MPLRHQRERAAGAGKDRGNHEIDRDDAVGGEAEIFDPQVVFADGEAGEPELGTEQDGRGDAGKAGGDHRDSIQHEVRFARIGKAHAEQGWAPDVKAVRTAQRGGLYQRAIKDHRERQRQHAEEDAAVASDQWTDHEAEHAAADSTDDHLRDRISEAPAHWQSARHRNRRRHRTSPGRTRRCRSAPAPRCRAKSAHWRRQLLQATRSRSAVRGRTG